MIMSINICPRCKGESIIVDNPADATQYLCAGCEIEMYAELHAVMNRYGLNKESAYEYLKTNRIVCDTDKNKSRIEELRKAVDEITSDDYCARVMDTVDSPVGDSLEMVIHHAERYIEVSEIVQKKVDELKQSRDYPHNFKGQMVEDFEWVLKLLN